MLVVDEFCKEMQESIRWYAEKIEAMELWLNDYSLSLSVPTFVRCAVSAQIVDFRTQMERSQAILDVEIGRLV